MAKKPENGTKSAVYVSKHDVHRTDDRNHVCDHVATGHFVHGRKVGKARRTKFYTVGLVSTIRHRINTKLALRMLDRCIHLSRGYMHALGEQLEVVNQLFHVALHPFSGRGRHLVIARNDRTRIFPQPDIHRRCLP